MHLTSTPCREMTTYLERRHDRAPRVVEWVGLDDLKATGTNKLLDGGLPVAQLWQHGAAAYSEWAHSGTKNVSFDFQVVVKPMRWHNERRLKNQLEFKTTCFHR